MYHFFMLGPIDLAWMNLVPPTVVGLSLYGVIAFSFIAQKFKGEHYGIVAVMSGVVLAYSLMECYTVLNGDEGWVFSLKLLVLIPALVTVPALARRVVPVGTQLYRWMDLIFKSVLVLSLLLISVSLMVPGALVTSSGVMGPTMMITDIILMVEVAFFTVLYIRHRKEADERVGSLRPYVLALAVIVPFGAIELVIDVMPAAAFPPWLLQFPHLAAGFLIFSIIIGLGSFRFAVGEAIRSTSSRAALEHEIWNDSLTGLPNRRSFRRRLDRHLMDRGSIGRTRMALILIDLDDFRSFNDTYGHLVGDEILKEASFRLHEALRDHDELYRLGSDEFAVILPVVEDSEETTLITSRLIDVFRSPVANRETGPVFLSASAGVATWPYDGTAARELMSHADAALARAKRQRNAYRAFSPDMSLETTQRVETVHRIKRALNDDRFSLKYQPVLDRSGAMVGAEALIRMAGDGGEILPGEFIPVAETTGLINPIGDWVINQALVDRAAGRHLPESFYFSVNLSVKQLREPKLAERIVTLMNAAGLTNHQIRFEITESSLMEYYREILPTIRAFKANGFTLGLDDFGTGYSSLGYLLDLPVDVLKLDRAFLLGVDRGGRGRAIVDSLVAMARGLNLEVIAEGIETVDHRDYMAGFDGVYQQGFLHGRPMTIERLAAMIGESR